MTATPPAERLRICPAHAVMLVAEPSARGTYSPRVWLAGGRAGRSSPRNAKPSAVRRDPVC
jgi:hypothetical protein